MWIARWSQTSVSIENTATPTKWTDNSQPIASKLVDRVIVRLDMDALAESLADKLGGKMVGSLNVDRIVTTLFDKHSDELHQGLVEAIVQRL